MNLNFYAKTKLAVPSSLRKYIVFSILAVMCFSNLYSQTPGTALNFGPFNYVSAPSRPQLNISSTLTLEAWIQTSNQSGRQNVICKSSFSVNNGYIFPRTENGWRDLQFRIYINSVGWKVLNVPYGTDKIGEWHHLAATYDGFYMRIFIDGVQAGEMEVSGSITVNNNPLFISGQSGYNNEYFLGTVDDVRIWNRALSQCEIASNMNCELAGTENGLAAYYKFNHGFINSLNLGVNSVTDETPYGNNGSLNGFLLTGIISNWAAGNVSGNCTAFTPVNATATSSRSAIPVGDNIELFATGGVDYAWVGPNGFSSTEQNPVITNAGLLESGTYTVVVTNNGCSASASVEVTVANRGKALNLDGGDNIVTIPDAPSLNSTAALSIETWIHPTSRIPDVQNILSKSNRLQNNGYIFPRTDDGWQSFSFWLAVNGQWKVLSAQYTDINQWNHVAATYDGFFMKIYLNGVEVASLSAPGSITLNSNALTIGQQEGFAEYFRGSVDEMRIWSRALTQCEIQNNLTCELNGDNNGLAAMNGLSAYYRFNQGLENTHNPTETTLIDSSSHGNHGTLQSFDLNNGSSNWVTGGVVNDAKCSPFLVTNASAWSNGPVLEVGSTIQLFASEGTSWAWTGPLGFTSTQQNGTISNATVDRSGTYTVNVTGGGCVSTASTNVQVAYKAGTLHFDGVNDHVTVPASASLHIPNTITLESWLYPTNNTKLEQDVMSKSTKEINTGYIFPRTDDAWGSYVFYLHLNGAWQKLSAPYPGINQWHHVAATYDGFYMRIYLDGVLSAAKEVEGTITQNINNLTLGQQPGFDEYFAGKVEEARIWNRALNQCEIINNMNCELDPSQNNGLVAYYKFNQGFLNANNTGITELIDASPNGNNGTLENFALNGLVSNWSEFKISGTCATYAQPPVSAASNGSIFGIGSTIKLFGSGGNSYSWDGPNGFVSGLQNPAITNAQVNASGTYTYTAQFVNCQVFASTRVRVSALQPIEVSGPTTFCPSTTVTLSTRNTGTAYQWFKNDIAIPGATAQSYIASESGVYTIQVTTATDILVSESVTLTVQDNLGPEPVVPQLPTLHMESPGTITAFPTAIDNCRGLITATTVNPVSYVENQTGTFTITWTYDDQNGNITTQDQEVIVVRAPDVTPPLVTLPSNQTVNTDANLCVATVNFQATATDNSLDPVTITYSQDPGTQFPIGTTTVTVTATDQSGNIANGSFTITVLPTVVAPITGNTVVCAGSTITLATASTIGSWSSSDNNIATVNASTGVVTGVSVGTVAILFTDYCGAFASANVTVTALPSAPAVTVSNNCGSSVLSANAVGNLLWSTGETTSSIIVSAGTYTVTQTVSGCTSAAGSATAMPLIIPSAPVITVNNYCGYSELSTNAGGNLLWSNGETTSSISVSAAGTYTVTQTVNGCTSAAGSATAAPKAIPSAPVVTVSNTCGSSVLSTNAGGDLLWSNGETTSSVIVSVAGTHFVTQTVNGCTSAAASVEAAPLAIPSAPVVTVSNTCGSSVLSTNAGGNLLWSTGETTSSITVSAAGVYTVTQSANGCTSAAASVTAAPLAMAAAPVVTISNNCGTTVLSTNATGDLLWSTGETTSSISVSAAGIYTVMQSLNGCTSAAASATAAPLAIPSAPVVTVSDNCGSSVLSTNAGGNLLWSNGETTSSIIVSGAGLYTVTQSVNGCISAAGSATAAPKAIPSAPVVTVSDNCGNSVLSTNAGGTLLWSNGATTSSITVSSGNTYTVTQTINGCVSAAGSGIANPVNTAAPVVSVSNNCGSSVLSATASGDLLWSTGETTSSIIVSEAGTYTVTQTVNGCTSAVTSVTAAPLAVPSAPVVTVSDNCGSSVLSTNAAGNLLWSTGETTSSIIVSAGTYTVIQILNGCSSAAGSATAAPLAIPSAPVVTVSNNCGSSVLSANAAGTLLWSTGETTSSVSVSSAGTYTVTQTLNGCTSAAGSVAAAPLAIPLAPVVTVNNNCGYSVLSTNAGGNLLWSNGETTSSISVSIAGIYTVTQTVNGCTSAASSVTSAPKAIPSAPVVTVSDNCGSSVLSTNAGGSLLWSNGATTASITVTASGNYHVTTTNSGGCSASSAVTAVSIHSIPVVQPITGTTSVNTSMRTQLSSATAGGVWSSSNPAVATVDASGLVTGVTVGSAIISYTVTTTEGCSTTVTTTVTVSPNCVAPVLSAVTSITTNTGSACSANVSYSSNVSGTPAPALTYQFTGATIGAGAGTGSGSLFNKGVTNVVISAANSCGTVTTSFTVTVRDATLPTAICKPLTVALVNGVATISAADINNGSYDNCGAVTLSASKTSFNCSNLGINTVILTVTDASGNSSSCSATVTVTGTPVTASVASIPSSTVYTGGVSTNLFIGYGAQSTTLQVTAPASGAPYTYTWSGNGASMLNSTTSGSPVFTPTSGNNYAFAVVITNKFGCSTTASITICVTDIRVMSSNSDDDDDDHQTMCDHRAHDYSDCSHRGHNHSSCNHRAHSKYDCGHRDSGDDDEEKDCDHKSHNYSDCSHRGHNHDSCNHRSHSSRDCDHDKSRSGSDTKVCDHRSHNSRDCNHNGHHHNSCSHSSHDSRQCQHNGGNGGNDDNDDKKVYLCHVPPGNSGQRITLSISVNAVAAHLANHSGDRLGSCDQQPCTGYVDTEKPDIECPNNITVSCSSSTATSVTGVATATDNSGGSILITYTDVVSGNTTTRTWKATDPSGNYSTCTQTISKVDNVKPVITIPANTTVCGTVTTPSVTGTATATDNCDASVTITYTDATSSNIITRTWKATDDAGNYSTATQTITKGGSFTSVITSIPTTSVYTGGVPTNIYLGYGAQSTKLQVSVPSSGAPYTYAWSGVTASKLSSTNSSAPVFTPGVFGYYTLAVVVTNKYGCAVTSSINICVTDIRVPGTNGTKVYVCHKSSSWSPTQTLQVPISQVASHIGNGNCGNNNNDRLGRCDQSPCNVPVATSADIVTQATVTKESGISMKAATTEEELKVTVMPNPSTTFFTLKLESKYETPVNLRVMDGSGRVVDARTKLGANSSFQIGHNYSSGTYYAELIQGSKRQVVQLIKSRG